MDDRSWSKKLQNIRIVMNIIFIVLWLFFHCHVFEKTFYLFMNTRMVRNVMEQAARQIHYLIIRKCL